MIEKLVPDDLSNLKNLAKQMRNDIVEMVYNAKSGHIGGSLSSVEIMSVLFSKIINLKENDIFRDRFILSKGHASPVYYSVLARLGYIDPCILQTFRQLGSKLQGHPSKNFLPLCDVSSGSLGQGLSVSLGIALALKLNKNEKSTVFSLLGDGELQEGNIWEGFMAASHYKLGNVIAIVDKNNLQIDGTTDEVLSLGNLKEKLETFGWNALEVDGHDFEKLYEVFQIAKQQRKKPNVIIANTKKGFGVSFMCENKDWHGKAPNKEQYLKAMEELK